MTENAIVAGMATTPERALLAWRVIDRIAPQVDALYVFLNGFPNDVSFLVEARWGKPRNVAFGRASSNLGDAMKFDGPCGDALRRPYCLTVDDDVDYPETFVSELFRACVEHDGAPVGWHGADFAERGQVEARGYYGARWTAHMSLARTHAREVDVLGTGALMWRRDRLPDLTLSDFEHPNMADIWFSLAAKRAGLPLTVVAHPPCKAFAEVIELPQIYTSSRGGDGSLRDTAAMQRKVVLDNWRVWRPDAE